MHAVYSNYELTFQFIDSKERQIKGYITEPVDVGQGAFVVLKSGVFTIDDYRAEINGGAYVYPDNHIELSAKHVAENDEGWNLNGKLFPM